MWPVDKQVIRNVYDNDSEYNVMLRTVYNYFFGKCSTDCFIKIA